MPGLYSHQRFCDLADAEVARLAGAIRGADPATRPRHLARLAGRGPDLPDPGPAGRRPRRPHVGLWGRRPTTDPRLTVTGDPALLAQWRQHAVI